MRAIFNRIETGTERFSGSIISALKYITARAEVGVFVCVRNVFGSSDMQFVLSRPYNAGSND